MIARTKGKISMKGEERKKKKYAQLVVENRIGVGRNILKKHTVENV